MFPSLFSGFSTLLLGLACFVNAAPVKPVEFLAIAPKVIYPCNGTVWGQGSTQNVTWATDDVPEEAQNYVVTIFLGQWIPPSENLNIRQPLAAQVPIMQGSASVTVPSGLTPADNYIVAVVGDSGNVSPTFIIQ